MTQTLEIYRCPICGNIVQVLHIGRGELVCCGKPMERLREKTAEAGLAERHAPVIERISQGIRVRVGTIPHPMETQHAIEWIDVRENGRVQVQMLDQGSAPQAEFPCATETARVRAYCNLHGLWTNRQ